MWGLHGCKSQGRCVWVMLILCFPREAIEYSLVSFIQEWPLRMRKSLMTEIGKPAEQSTISHLRKLESKDMISKWNFYLNKDAFTNVPISASQRKVKGCYLRKWFSYEMCRLVRHYNQCKLWISATLLSLIIECDLINVMRSI